MKFLNNVSLLLLIVICCNSCLLTLYPVYTVNDITYHPNLQGTYRSGKSDHPALLTIANLAGTSITLPPKVAAIAKQGYYLRYQDETGRTLSEYAAFTVKLSGKTYIDLFPLSGKFGGDEFYQALTIPMHAIYQVEWDSATITLLPMDQDFMEQRIKAKEISVKREVSVADRDVSVSIITAGTKDLQAYISRYGNNTEAFDQREIEIYKRVIQ